MIIDSTGVVCMNDYSLKKQGYLFKIQLDKKQSSFYLTESTRYLIVTSAILDQNFPVKYVLLVKGL
jgi:hypothetical protein